MVMAKKKMERGREWGEREDGRWFDGAVVMKRLLAEEAEEEEEEEVMSRAKVKGEKRGAGHEWKRRVDWRVK